MRPLPGASPGAAACHHVWTRLHGLEAQISRIAWGPEDLCRLWEEAAGSLTWAEVRRGSGARVTTADARTHPPPSTPREAELAFCLEARSHPQSLSASLSMGSIPPGTAREWARAVLPASFSLIPNPWILLGAPPALPLSTHAV